MTEEIKVPPILMNDLSLIPRTYTVEGPSSKHSTHTHTHRLTGKIV